MKLLLSTCLLLLAAAAGTSPAVAEEYRLQREHVLGTSMELMVSAESEAAAEQIEQRVLDEIQRLAKIFSRYDANSELMQWQAGNVASTQLSAELTFVLQRAEHWRTTTGGAFDVRSGALAQLWKASAEQGERPSDAERQQLAAKLAHAPYQTDNIQRLDTLAISLDALAKGYILDKACELVEREFPQCGDFTINIGGDLRKLGDVPLEIAITNPRAASEQAAPLETFIATRPLAMATSGDYRRSLEVAGHRVSHIFDPRTGLPTAEVASASVVAANAMDADALATALCVLGPAEGLALVESLDATECCVVTADGRIVHSSGWPFGSPVSDASLLVMHQEEDAAKEKSGLYVDFSLVRPKGGRGYRRPYVAVWLEDTDGFPVKTAVLWMQTEQPGPRWHRDLTRWYRGDRMRKVVEETELIGTISTVTRGPGEYDAYFDGTDNAGQPLKPGKYTLCLEVAREHGTYQLIREKIEWGEQPIAEKELKGNVEMEDISYRFVPAKDEAKTDAS
ncbi:DUF2271 domain-containing protein [Blastopirellula marina]|uniref:FAD:protein FMN transferase n=1 Tax=Blastopirellula marina TaxID=124 RepID=A0A2S8GM13_9BACT|nr:DUF2271 domain-containing protein [Blastopirellula marina]PQO45361.1 DUF2271 domain-containing protein [Blastopirellula marina]